MFEFVENGVRNVVTSVGNLALDVQINYHENMVKSGVKTEPKTDLERIKKQISLDSFCPEALTEKIYKSFSGVAANNRITAACRGVKVCLSVFDKMLVHPDRDGFEWNQKYCQEAEASLMEYFCVDSYKNIKAKDVPDIKTFVNINNRDIMLDDSVITECFDRVCFNHGLHYTLEVNIDKGTFAIYDGKSKSPIRYRGLKFNSDDLRESEEEKAERLRKAEESASATPEAPVEQPLTHLLELDGPTITVVDCEVKDGKASPINERNKTQKPKQKPKEKAVEVVKTSKEEVKTSAPTAEPKAAEPHEPIAVFHTQEESEKFVTRKPEWMEQKLFDKLEKFVSRILPNVEHEYMRFGSILIQISFINGMEPLLIDDGSMFAMGVRLIYDELPVSIDSVDKIKGLLKRYPRSLSNKEREKIEAKMFTNQNIYRFFDFSEVKDVIVQLPETERVKFGKKLEGVLDIMTDWRSKTRFRVTDFVTINDFKLLSDEKVKMTNESDFWIWPSYRFEVKDDNIHFIDGDSVTTYDIKYRR